MLYIDTGRCRRRLYFFSFFSAPAARLGRRGRIRWERDYLERKENDSIRNELLVVVVVKE